jgi:cell division protein FtsW (lipid II flippase)
MTAFKIARRLWCLATPVPALIVGTLIMRQHDVPSSRWGLNLLGGAIAAAICSVFLTKSRLPMSKRAATVSACFVAGALAATFHGTGSMGVHRWIQVGPLTMHVGAVSLPLFIVALGVLDAFGGKLRWGPMLLAMAVAMLLWLQPDAAQATAFAAAVFTLLIANKQRALAAWIAALVIAALAGWTWTQRDPLLPVPYVEGIIGLARQSGPVWLLASLAALAVLPLPFFIGPSGSQSAFVRALGVYWCVCVLAPLFGPFPVPLVGFGLSPIVGYFLALGSLCVLPQPAHDDLTTRSSPESIRG